MKLLSIFALLALAALGAILFSVRKAGGEMESVNK
jgi:hypothetical protein